MHRAGSSKVLQGRTGMRRSHQQGSLCPEPQIDLRAPDAQQLPMTPHVPFTGPHQVTCDCCSHYWFLHLFILPNLTTAPLLAEFRLKDPSIEFEKCLTKGELRRVRLVLSINGVMLAQPLKLLSQLSNLLPGVLRH